VWFQRYGFVAVVMKRSDLLSRHRIQARDLRFSAASSLCVRTDNIIMRLQVGVAGGVVIT